MVDVKFERMTSRYIPLHELKELHVKHKASGGPLRNLALFTRARLSVMPISDGMFNTLCTGTFFQNRMAFHSFP